MTGFTNRAGWIAAAVAAAVVLVVAVCVIALWAAVGNSQISAAGWAAMILGILMTLALGIGLMSLVFISNRRGYDDPDRPN